MIGNLSHVPDHLRNRAAKGTSHAAMAGSVSGPPRISLKDDGFTFIDAAGQERSHDLKYLDVVIVDVNPNKSKYYYDGPYVAGQNKVATCFSIDGIMPSPQGSKPQPGPCSTCQLGQFGSATNNMGQPTSHCKPKKRIAVVVPELNNDMVFLLEVATTSITPLANYAKELMGVSMGDRPAELGDVVTRLRIKEKKLDFEAMSFIDDRIALLCDKLDQTDKTGILVGRIADPMDQGQLAYDTRAAKQIVYDKTSSVVHNNEPPVGFGHTVAPVEKQRTYYYDDKGKVQGGDPDFIGDKPEPIDEIPEHSLPVVKNASNIQAINVIAEIPPRSHDVNPSASFGMAPAHAAPGALTDEQKKAFNFQTGGV